MTFRALFDDMYIGNHDYDDFMNCDIQIESTKKYIDNNLVYVASEKMRAYQSFLNINVIQKLKVNEDVVFSYRKGVNVVDAVQKHAANKHFYQIDLQNFFASIDSSLIERVLLAASGNMPYAEPEKYISSA